jgi:ParB family chromosome partitioning protein
MQVTKKSGLGGRGLSAILSSVTKKDELNAKDSNIKDLKLDCIIPGRSQPRKHIDQNSLNELASSIKSQGLIQPIVVRLVDKGVYEIIAGERRWRAAEIAGLKTIPCVIKNVDEFSAHAISLIENIQRSNLNPLEESLAYQKLINEFNLTHQQISDAVGKPRTTISNSLRLLSLSDYVKNLLKENKIDVGHCKLLGGLNSSQQKKYADLCVNNGLSVRALEKLIMTTPGKTSTQNKKTAKKKEVDIVKLENKLSDLFATKVNISHSKRGSGKITIHYHSIEEFEGLLEHFK